jgi:hypothetical protein
MDTSSTENTNEISESLILDLEALTIKYQNLLIEYQQAVVNYINYIKEETQDLSNNDLSFVTVKASTYWGTSGLSQNNSNTLDKCIDSCKKTTGCTGATYNATNYSTPMCFLRSGSSSISPSEKAGDYAIVNKGQYLLLNVQSINEQLTAVNQEIVEKTLESQPLRASNLEESISQNKILESKYISLALDREKITQMMNEYQTLDENQVQGNIKINQSYYSFILLLALSIFVVYILLYIFSGNSSSNPVLQPGGNLNANTYYVICAIIVMTLAIYFYSKYY